MDVRDGDKITGAARGITSDLVFEYLVNWTRAKDGKRLTLGFQITDADGDRTIASRNKNDEFEGDGTITSATIRIVAGTVPSGPGEEFVELDLRRNNKIIGSVAAGYMFGGHPVSYPNAVLEGSLDGPGRKVNNEAPSTLVNNTALTRTITVPTFTRVRVEGGRVFNADDVARSITITADDGTQEIIRYNQDSLGASGVLAYPNTVTNQDGYSPGSSDLLVAGDRVNIAFAAGGASAGGTARSSCNWEEWLAFA